MYDFYLEFYTLQTMATIKRRAKYFILILAYVGLIAFIAEYLLYYVVMFQCKWPGFSALLDNSEAENDFGQIGDSEWIFRERETANVFPRSTGLDVPQVPETEKIPSPVHSNHGISESTVLSEKNLRAFFIADTHLLGSHLGHWFDKLRREWQMERAFQTAMTLLTPEAVFVLGDLTDEGKWASDEEFDATTKRFWKMFSHPSNVHFKVVPGNHDVGFHNFMKKHKLERFLKAFSAASVEVVTLKNMSFILVNSMAFHGDGCSICSEAERALRRLSRQLNCSRHGTKRETGPDAGCSQDLPSTSPILLQHFPLYRPSDEMCGGVDGTPIEEKHIAHAERREVISREATDKLLRWIQPRLVLSGHTHHGCYIVHSNETPEISVPSFSWRNRKNPSIVLATITPSSIALNKCFLPEEVLIIYIYSASGIVMTVWLLWSFISFMLERSRMKQMKRL